MNIGAKNVTDSLTPRKLRSMRNPRIKNSNVSLWTIQVCGRKDHKASHPEATDTDMVKT